MAINYKQPRETGSIGHARKTRKKTTTTKKQKKTKQKTRKKQQHIKLKRWATQTPPGNLGRIRVRDEYEVLASDMTPAILLI